MNLPEPVAWLDVEMQQAYTVDELADAEGTGFVPLFTETQMREALARQEAVMRQALGVMAHAVSLSDAYWGATEFDDAVKALEEALK